MTAWISHGPIDFYAAEWKNLSIAKLEWEVIHVHIPDRSVADLAGSQGGSVRGWDGPPGRGGEGGGERRGRLESFYFGFGDRDVYVIADFPDNESAAAMAMAVNSSGAVTTRTVVLLTPAEIDGAAKRSVQYRAPGA